MWVRKIMRKYSPGFVGLCRCRHMTVAKGFYVTRDDPQISSVMRDGAKISRVMRDWTSQRDA